MKGGRDTRQGGGETKGKAKNQCIYIWFIGYEVFHASLQKLQLSRSFFNHTREVRTQVTVTAIELLGMYQVQRVTSWIKRNKETAACDIHGPRYIIYAVQNTKTSQTRKRKKLKEEKLRKSLFMSFPFPCSLSLSTPRSLHPLA